MIHHKLPGQIITANIHSENNKNRNKHTLLLTVSAECRTSCEVNVVFAGAVSHLATVRVTFPWNRRAS